MSTVSAAEQLLLELINRARLDPLGEAARFGVDLNQGVAPEDFISGTPKQPLAHSTILANAADLHSQWMLDTNIFSHTGSGGSDAGARMAAAGYVFAGDWIWSENLSWRGSTLAINENTVIVRQHQDLFLSPSHREGMLLEGLAEAGISQIIGYYTHENTVYNASMVTENFASTLSETFVTGVIYNDTSGDDFYSVGEGVGGLAVSADGVATTSAAAGGYAVKVTGDVATVSFGTGPTAISADVTINGRNAKVDLVDGDTLLTSSDLTLGANASDARALGVADIGLIGNDDANELIGNSGTNFLIGGAGDDTLLGGDGVDVLWGADGDDVVTGGAGTDFFLFSVAHEGVEYFTDFTQGEDLLLFFVDGTLPAPAPIAGLGIFNSGVGLAAETGPDGAPMFYFDTAATELYFDFDGGDSSNATLLADLNGALVDETDIFLL